MSADCTKDNDETHVARRVLQYATDNDGTD